jgi:hypothetical protein
MLGFVTLLLGAVGFEGPVSAHPPYCQLAGFELSTEGPECEISFSLTTDGR